MTCESTPGRRTWLGYLLLVMALPVAVYADALLPGRSFFHDDFVMGFYSMRSLLWQMGRSGHLFFWNPYIFCGMPLAGDIHAAMFYPGNWPAYLLPPTLSSSLYVVVHLALGGAFTFLLLREYGCSARAAALGGICFGLNGSFICHIPRINLLGVGIWLPAALWGLERYARSRRSAWLAWISLCLGLQLTAGFPQTSLYLVICYVLYGLLRPLWAPTPGLVGWWLRTIALPGVLGALLAGIQLAPFFELIFKSPRFAVNYPAVANAIGWTPWTLLASFFPELQHLPPHSFHFGTEHFSYIGVMPVLLALACLRRPNRRNLILLGLALFFWLLMLGHQGPLGWLLAHTPGLREARLQNRWMYAVNFCVALLAGLGSETLLARVSSRQRALVFVLLLAATGGELAWMARTHNVVSADTFYRHCPPALQRVANDRAYPPARFATMPGDWVQMRYADLGMRWDLYNVIGVDSSVTAPYVAYLFYSDMGRLPDMASLNRLISISYAIPMVHPESPMMKLANLGFVVEPSPRGVRVRVLPQPYPRAFLVPSWRVVPRTDQLPILHSASFNGRREVLLDRDPHWPRSAAPLKGTVKFLDYQPDHLVLQVSTPRPAMLFLSEAYFPGWRASVDGSPAPVLQADLVFRAVPVPAGSHLVRLDYRPMSIRVGLLVTLLGLLGTALLAAWSGIRAKS